MKYDALGIRMKEYEAVNDNKLINNMPVIIRLDGRAFHTFTKGLDKPFDNEFSRFMQETMQYLCENISNCVFGYTQSDEITLVLFNANREAQPWFDNRIEKIVSSAASMATLAFNKSINDYIKTLWDGLGWNVEESEKWSKRLFKGTFDARVFNVPMHEVVNNLIWRQQDAAKNSINTLAQAHFSHKELQGKNGSDMQDMLMLQRNVNWNNLPTKYKRGSACIRKEIEVDTPNGKVMRKKWVIDSEMPILTENKAYVEDLLMGD